MDTEIVIFIAVGFVAQLIDGSLGMAYGVTSTTFLLSLGIPPALASASVHSSEIFASGASGLAHLRFGNVNRGIVWRLAVPGVVGGVLGAYILTTLPGDAIKPFVALYLGLMGVVILLKASRKPKETEVRTKLIPLGLMGGFLDAIGGGGWGPIVTGTLVARGNNPRYTIGSVNLAEFFVTVAQSVTFILALGFLHWNATIGLIVGGVVAAPFAAYICKKIPTRGLMLLVGAVVLALSLRTLVLAIAQ